MNTSNGSAARLGKAGKPLMRRYSLALRALELLVLVALYLGGLVVMGEMTGTSSLPFMAFAMFGMLVVLSVLLRLLWAIERRLGLARGRVSHLI